MRVAVAWLLAMLLGALALAPTALAAVGADESVGGIALSKLRKLEHGKAPRGKGIFPSSGGATTSTPTGTTTTGVGTGSSTTTAPGGSSTTAPTTPGASTPTGPTTGRSPQEIETQIKELERGRIGASHAPVAKHSSSKLSGTGIALIVVAAVVVLCALLWALFSFAVLEPHWLLSLRHSLSEAGYRASAVWAEFTDWVRLGH
jgi:cobalamin biosynthesis Mg chelatase CobN